MRRRICILAASAIAAVSGAVVVAPAPAVVRAAPGPTDPVAIVIEGKGFGHGIGMSQWGAFGRAVDGGQSWQEILAAYYGGTNLADVNPATRVTVRLTALDDRQTAVISTGPGAYWNGMGPYGALMARETTQNTYEIRASATPACPDAADPLAGWTVLGTTTGPLAFTTPNGDDPAAGGGEVLGVCQADGSVRHYRGAIRAANGTEGENRTVNDVAAEAYLRGVVPREVAATWGAAGDGRGMHALRAQAVAARSYGLRQARYSYAMTCDTQSCQVYGGAATRPGATSGATVIEHALTDQAIVETASKVLRWNSDGTIVSTMFSASNGGASAGVNHPAIDDPWDVRDNNPNARWTRVISASAFASRFGITGTVTSASVQPDPNLVDDGYTNGWQNRAVVRATGGTATITAAALRSAYGLPSTALSVRLVTRDLVSPADFAMIGDSVGQGIANGSGGALITLLDGVFASAAFVNEQNRRTVCAGCAPPDGVVVAQGLSTPPDIAVVQLGYNDGASLTAARIDQMMSALAAKGVATVGWVGLSERKDGYRGVNDLLIAAQARWPQLRYLDWDTASRCSARDRWFASDGVHLTTTGNAEFALWLRDRVIELAGGRASAVGSQFSLQLCAGGVMRLPMGQLVPPGTTAVSLNVTVAEAQGWGYVTVWPCAAARPEASNLNYVAGDTVPNAVIAPLDANGDVCFYSYAAAHLLVDLNGWFTSGLSTVVPARLVDTRNGIGAGVGRVQPAQPLRVKVAGVGVVPANASAVSLNVTVAEAQGWGYVTVWPCAAARPEASNLNYVAGDTVPNAVIAPVDVNGEICLYTYDPVHLLVDLNGWFTSGLSTVVPTRVADTRTGARAAGL